MPGTPSGEQLPFLPLEGPGRGARRGAGSILLSLCLITSGDAASLCRGCVQSSPVVPPSRGPAWPLWLVQRTWPARVRPSP
ncbi:hypothetical protein T484DRAFT_1949347 [Baffinella frigidus]|nr:hypothetical protein T484DRAFT_1949347 [Cryptophyta sp. CCMP2293]